MAEDRTPTVRAAGGVVVRDGPDGPEVLLVHRPAYDDWSLPKGKCGPGEDDRACARREVAEETGLTLTPLRRVGTTTYTDSRGRPKRVTWWLMAAPPDASPTPDGTETDGFRWVPVDRLARVCTYRRDVDTVHRALRSRQLR